MLHAVNLACDDPEVPAAFEPQYFACRPDSFLVSAKCGEQRWRHFGTYDPGCLTRIACIRTHLGGCPEVAFGEPLFSHGIKDGIGDGGGVVHEIVVSLSMHSQERALVIFLRLPDVRRASRLLQAFSITKFPRLRFQVGRYTRRVRYRRTVLEGPFMSGARKGAGRPGITLEDVQRACEILDEEGRATGPHNVRLVLRAGSYTTILKHLRALGRAPSAGTRRGVKRAP